MWLSDRCSTRSGAARPATATVAAVSVILLWACSSVAMSDAARPRPGWGQLGHTVPGWPCGLGRNNVKWRLAVQAALCLLAGKVSWPTYFRHTANRHFTLLRPWALAVQ